MVMIMGTSICHLVIGEERHEVEGMCGVIQGGITPGTWGFEAGQSCVGDHFAWFVESQLRQSTWPRLRTVASRSIECWRSVRRGIAPGESGLLALDWWNGNRSVLVDADLTGLMVGMTLQTKPEEMYRALMEATAYGTRAIIEAFERQGVPVAQLVACWWAAGRESIAHADLLRCHRPRDLGRPVAADPGVGRSDARCGRGRQ